MKAAQGSQLEIIAKANHLCNLDQPEVFTAVAARCGLDPVAMTTQDFWKAVACMGGYLARRSDGPPGWKTLLEGFRLASHHRLKFVYKSQGFSRRESSLYFYT